MTFFFYSDLIRSKKGRLMWSQQDMSINSSHDWLPANDLSWLIRLPTSQDLISFLGCMQDTLKGIVIQLHRYIYIKYFVKLNILLLLPNNHENEYVNKEKIIISRIHYGFSAQLIFILSKFYILGAPELLWIAEKNFPISN